MSVARLTEAERLRRHNEEMKLALAENCTVLEARRRLALRRWNEFNARMQRRRRCGTGAAAEPSAGTDYTIALTNGGGPLRQPFWWERD